MITSEIHIALWVLLAVFTAGAFILAGTTLLNVIRLRNVRISWKAGKMKGYPIFSSIFLFITLVIAGIGLYEDSVAELMVASFYLILSSAWFLTSFLASKRYITDHGIVKNVNEPSQTVAWHQIRDFVEHDYGAGVKFTFIYSESERRFVQKIVQLELKVPAQMVNEFKKLISHKLGRRISCYDNESMKVEQFE